MNKLSKKDLIYPLLSVILIIIDQIIKIKVQLNMQESQRIHIIQNFFSISYIKNRGAAFGILQNRKNTFLFIGIITIFVLIYFFIKNKDKIIRFCVCLIIAGAVGNMIDRIKYGYVVDMFDFHGIWSYVFNFADICVVVGIIILSIKIFTEK